MSAAILFTTVPARRRAGLCFSSCLSAACGSNGVADSVLMGSEMSNKAPRSRETAGADTRLSHKGQTDRFHTPTEGRTSRRAAGGGAPQMDAGEELLYIRAGGRPRERRRLQPRSHPNGQKHTESSLQSNNYFLSCCWNQTCQNRQSSAASRRSGVAY